MLCGSDCAIAHPNSDSSLAASYSSSPNAANVGIDAGDEIFPLKSLETAVISFDFGISRSKVAAVAAAYSFEDGKVFSFEDLVFIGCPVRPPPNCIENKEVDDHGEENSAKVEARGRNGDGMLHTSDSNAILIDSDG